MLFRRYSPRDVETRDVCTALLIFSLLGWCSETIGFDHPQHIDDRNAEREMLKWVGEPIDLKSIDFASATLVSREMLRLTCHAWLTHRGGSKIPPHSYSLVSNCAT